MCGMWSVTPSPPASGVITTAVDEPVSLFAERGESGRPVKRVSRGMVRDREVESALQDDPAGHRATVFRGRSAWRGVGCRGGKSGWIGYVPFDGLKEGARRGGEGPVAVHQRNPQVGGGVDGQDVGSGASR
jgi:hypothetical protein